MQNINNDVQEFLKKHKNNQRYIFVLILLSVMVIAIVCSSLITPAVSMTGKLVCQKEEHTHTDECYSDTLICTEDTEGHHHTEDCYKTTTVLTCGLEEDENHTHSDECYTTEKILDCDIPESDGHVHTDECYERTLICGREEHEHTDECYENPPAETENINETEVETEPTTEEVKEPDSVTIDPIDAEQDALLNAFKAKKMKVNSYNTYSTNGNVTVISSTSVNFGEFIKGITQQDVSGSSTATDEKTVKFTINYNLPANTLLNGSDNRQIHCLLPDNVTIPELREGIVRKEGQEIGTYKITNDGYIIIEFDQNFVKDGGTVINGDISFNAVVHKTDAESKYETVTIGKVSVNIPFLSETTKQNDLSVDKSYVGYDKDTKKVTYKLDIKSYNGSGDGDINVTDMLYYTDSSLINLDWKTGDIASFTKRSADGSTSEVTAAVSVADDGTVSINGLPPLGENESYTIEYTATLTPDDKTQIIKTNNKAVVSNGTLTDESIYYGQTAVSCGISKKGQYNDKTDRVEWTISFTNPFETVLDGYTVSDLMLGKAVSGLVIKDSNGQVIETLTSDNPSGATGKLDVNTNTFSFNSDVNGKAYTLYYETTLPDRSSISNSTISNKAILKSNDKELNTPSADAYIGADRRGVNKYCRKAAYDENSNLKLDWYVALDFQTGDFKGQTYKDTMTSTTDENYHYMTSDLISSLKLIGYKPDNFEVQLESGTDYTIKWYDSNGNAIDSVTSESRIYSFEVVFADNDKIGELSDIDIYYTCLGDTSGMAEGSSRVFTNQSQFMEITKTASYVETKKKPFEKYDSLKTGVSETEHNSNELEVNSDGKYVLKWYIDANENGHYKPTQDITFTDVLPAGLSFDSSYLYYGDWRNGGYTRISESSMTYDVSEDANGQQTVTFSIPASLHNGQKFRIEYAAALDKDYLMKYKDNQEKVKFKNIVSEGDFTSEQTQTIERSLISKTGSDPESSYDGYIDYSIDVNPTAETLSNNGKITVIDTVNYEYKAFVPTLKDINVYVVETDESGNEVLTELDPAKYELSYTNDNKNAKFTAVLPDKTHLKIKYRYFCIYKNPEWFKPIDSGIEIYNSVNLKFDNGLQKTDYKDRYYLNKESDAHAATDDYLQIRKVDADNYAVRLKGAEFSLYKWDGSLWLPVTATDESTAGKIIPTWGTAEDDEPYLFVTDDKGKALLPELESRVVYKLVEKTAPTDYIKTTVPYYFAEESTPATLPADVKSADVMVLLKGGVITIPNNKMVKTQVDVQKYWHDAPGFSGVHDGVEVQLYQSKTDPSGKIDGPEITFGFDDIKGNSDVKVFNVQRGEDVTMKIRTFGAYLNDNGANSLFINGNEFNWYNPTGEAKDFAGRVTIRQSFGGNPWIPDEQVKADEGWMNDPNKYIEYTLTYTNVTEDTEFRLHFDRAKQCSEYAIFIGNQEVGVPVSGIPDDAVPIGNPVTLNNDNNWYYKWDNILKTDEYGYNYYYYVQEVTTVTDYTPDYDNNGVNEGTINITNKGKGYTNEMPKTGGIGNKPMIITGIILISGSSALYILSKRRRKRC